MRFGPSALLLLADLTLAPGWAVAATSEPIGSAVVVVNRVTAEIAQDVRTLHMGDDVAQNEIIEVGADGRSELQLKDDTKVALGPGSRLLLDRFVYNGERSHGSIGLNFVKGAFRFVTGIASKPSYTIRVPNASITVRGTIFDVFIELNDVVWLLLHEGSVRVCNDRGMCRIHSEPGKLIRISDGGNVGSPSRWTSLPGRQNIAFDNAFPFVVASPRFDPTPVFTREAILLGQFRRPQHTRDPRHPQYPGGRTGDKGPSLDLKKTTITKHTVKTPRRITSGTTAIGKKTIVTKHSVKTPRRIPHGTSTTGTGLKSQGQNRLRNR